MFVVNVHLSLLPSNSSPAGNHHQPAALSTVLKVCWFGMATSHEIHESCLWRVWSGQSGPQAFPNTIDTLRILSATWGQLGCFNLFQSAHLHFSLNHDQFWAFPPHWRDEACHESQGKCWPSLWLIVSSIQPVKPLSDKIWQVIYIQHHSTSSISSQAHPIRAQHQPHSRMGPLGTRPALHDREEKTARSVGHRRSGAHLELWVRWHVPGPDSATLGVSKVGERPRYLETCNTQYYSILIMYNTHQ